MDCQNPPVVDLTLDDDESDDGSVILSPNEPSESVVIQLVDEEIDDETGNYAVECILRKFIEQHPVPFGIPINSETLGNSNENEASIQRLHEVTPNYVVTDVIDLTIDEEPRYVSSAVLIEPSRGKFSREIPIPNIIKVSKNCEDNISRVELIWTCNKSQSQQMKIQNYEIFFHDSSKIVHSNSVQKWDYIGEVISLPLPMSCKIAMSLIENHNYSFMMRAKDIENRCGPFSEVKGIKIENDD